MYGEEYRKIKVVQKKDIDQWMNSNGSNVDRGSKERKNERKKG